jgi:hypothetical protein
MGSDEFEKKTTKRFTKIKSIQSKINKLWNYNENNTTGCILGNSQNDCVCE